MGTWGVSGSLRSSTHFTLCLLITRLILDHRLQEDQKINALSSLFPCSDPGVILKAAVAIPAALLNLLLENRLQVPKHAQGPL